MGGPEQFLHGGAAAAAERSPLGTQCCCPWPAGAAARRECCGVGSAGAAGDGEAGLGAGQQEPAGFPAGDARVPAAQGPVPHCERRPEDGSGGAPASDQGARHPAVPGGAAHFGEVAYVVALSDTIAVIGRPSHHPFASFAFFFVHVCVVSPA